MRLNANPNDISTPFMDIVERTGSGIYDVELKTRLGDLSGVAGTRNIPSGFEGFGLMTETAFLSGSNIKLEAPRFLLGDLNSTFVSGSNRNIEISSSRFHLQPDGDTIMQGKITATSGTIGGFNIDSDLDSTSGTLKLKGASGQITGSNVLFDGGKIGGFDVSANEISSSGMSLDSANQVVIFRDVDGSTLGTAGQEALRISFDGSAVIPSGTTTTTGERARIHVPSGSLAASDLVINTEVLNNVRIVPGRLRCFRKDGSGLPSDGNGKSILNPTSLGNNFNKHLDAAAYFPNSNRDGDFSTLDFNLGVLGYASRATNSGTSRQVALYGLSNVGAGAISIYGEVLQENGGYSGVFHGGQLVVGDVIGTGGSGVDSTTDSDFVFVAYPNDIDGGTYNSYKGRVGINKRLPDTALHVNGTISGSLFGPILSSTISGSLINSSGDVVAFQSSDKKLKDNVSVILKPIEKVKQISGYEFDWNNKQDIYQGHDFGVIAQEVEKVMPELVRTNSNGFKGVKYEKIVPLLIESIKEQQKQIDELKKKLEEL